MNFSELGLNAALLRSLEENNISNPSEIQQKVIPFILNNAKNLIGISQTGTGKTAAFGLPVLQQIDPQLIETQVLVLVPTRELAQQVAKDIFVFSRYIVRIHTEALFGGKKIEEQIQKLEKPKHILVATPGRLLDLLSRKAIDLSHLKFLVLDEADEMLNLGFKPDIDKIVKACRPSVRKLLFTSTLPAALKKTVSQYVGDKAEEITVRPQEFVNQLIEHQYVAYQYGYKLEYLKAYLLKHVDEKGIIFCRTQAASKLLGQQLAGFAVSTGSLYGDLGQYDRNKILSAFKTNRIQVLIATDVAARGLDVQDLKFVIHYHLPEEEAQYVNRSGRTGRAGRKGRSVCLLQEDELHQKDKLAAALNLKFHPLKLEVTIDKTPSLPVKVAINLGTRHDLNATSMVEFLTTYSGVKKEAISEVEVYMIETLFTVESKYCDQLFNNLNHSKHFHQRIVLEKTGDQ